MPRSALQTLTDIIPVLRDGDNRGRLEALEILCAVIENGGLEPDVLAKYVQHITPMIDDTRDEVRLLAVQSFDYLEPDVLAQYAHHIVPRLDDEDWTVRANVVRTLCKPGVLAKYADHIVPRLVDEDWHVRFTAGMCIYAFDALAKVPLVPLVPHRYALRSSEEHCLFVQDSVASLRRRVWLVRLRQLFWCQRLVWYWGSRACRPGSRQARAAASEFGRMQGVSAEEGGEREVKRARVE